jgi:hypothetical protein
MSTRSNVRTGGSEVSIAVLTMKLASMNDQFDSQCSVREITNGVGVAAEMFGLRGPLTVGTQSDLGGPNEGESDGIRRSVVAFVDDLKAVKTQLACPQIQAAQFLHGCLLILGDLPHPVSYSPQDFSETIVHKLLSGNHLR